MAETDEQAQDPREPISVRARFERFPATVKGAFVVRGEDANPHLITFRDARILRLGSKDTRPVGMKAGTLDIPPHQDVFLPFEFSISELESGWYGLECDLDLDGVNTTFDGGRRFVVPWARGAVVRSAVSIGEKIVVADDCTVRVDGLDGSSDQATLRYAVEPPEAADGLSVKVLGDGERLAELEATMDEVSGEGKLTVTPILRGYRNVRIECKRGRDAASSAEVPLPE